MIVQIASSIVAGSILCVAFINKSGGTSEAAKIQEIFTNSGLSKRGGTIHLQRRTRREWGTEYAYRIPLGLSFNDFLSKRDAFQDGLNNRRTINFTLADLKQITFKEPLLPQIKWLLKPHGSKEIEMEYDGLLKIRVYNEPLTDSLPFGEEIMNKCKGWQVPVGESRTGFIKHDFDKVAHIIVAGTTDFGKSNWLNSMITTLIHNKPHDVSFTLIDLKGGLSFARYKNTAQCETVAENNKQAAEALLKVQEKMSGMMQRLKVSGHQDVKSAKIRKRHFVIIDEAADAAGDKGIQEAFADIARRGRAVGIRLVYATQYPTTETIASQVKRNCLGRMCFKIDTGTASAVVLDETGAEDLPLLPGRCIYKAHSKHTAQTPKIEDSFIDKVIKPHIKARDDDANSNPERTESGADFIDVEETGLS